MSTKLYTYRSFGNLFWNKIKRLFELVLSGQLSVIWKEFNRRLNSTSLILGLHRNLRDDFTPPPAKIDFSLRLIKEGDADIILNNEKLKGSFTSLAEKRKKLVQENIPNCYVAVTKDGTPCFMQWLIGSEENEQIQHFFGNLFPKLKKNEAIFTSAFTNPDFRGKGIMPTAMSKIVTEKASKMGIQETITFVDVNNIPSLKGCRRAGFSPYLLKKDQWFLFKRYVSYEIVPRDILLEYYKKTGGRKKRTVTVEG